MTALDLVDFACSAAAFGVTSLTAALGLAWSPNRASRYLTAFFACLALECLVGTIALGASGSLSATALRWLHVINVPNAYLFGPLLYGYAVALTSASEPFSKGTGLCHAMPALAALAFSLGNAIFPFDRGEFGHALFRVSFDAWSLQGLPYFALAAWRTRQARQLLEQVSADEAALHLAWLRWLALVVGFSWMLAAINRLLGARRWAGWEWVDMSLGVLVIVALYLLAWFGLRQRILMPIGPGELPAVSERPAASPYARSGLEAGQCTAVAADLVRLMTQERLYADSRLDLQALSQRSGWPPNYISQALNQGLGQNFFEFTNGHRVEAARHCLADADDARTILDIALACGFGSKSTFNTVFKRMTGLTPSEYRRSRAIARAEPAA